MAVSLWTPGTGRVARAAGPTGTTITLSVLVGPPTTRTTVTGTGFGGAEIVDLTFEGRLLARATTDETGGFSRQIKVPKWALPGDHPVVGTGESSGLTASATFLVRTDWAMFHFSLDRRGENPYENVLSPSSVSQLTPLWTAEAPSTLIESPAIVGGRVYQGDADGALLAADAVTGQVLWKVRFAVSSELSAPAVANGLVFVGAVGGKIYAVDAATGARRWSRDLDGLIFDSPLVTDGVVYIAAGTLNGTLYALDAVTGATIWTADYGGGSSSPALSNGVIYIAGGVVDASVWAFNAQDGTLQWSRTVKGYIDTTPSIAKGVLYVGTSNTLYERVYALDAVTGEPLWNHIVGGDVEGSPAVANGVVYAGSVDDGRLTALDAATGAALWSFAAGDDVWASPVVANGVVYFGSHDKSLYALDAQTGALLWSFAGDDWWGDPAVCDGVLYVGSFDSTLYAFGLP